VWKNNKIIFDVNAKISELQSNKIEPIWWGKNYDQFGVLTSESSCEQDSIYFIHYHQNGGIRLKYLLSKNKFEWIHYGKDGRLYDYIVGTGLDLTEGWSSMGESELKEYFGRDVLLNPKINPNCSGCEGTGLGIECGKYIIENSKLLREGEWILYDFNDNIINKQNELIIKFLCWKVSIWQSQ
jgi:hypothetical protein